MATNITTTFETASNYTSGSGVLVDSGSNGLAILSGSYGGGQTNDYSLFFPTGTSKTNVVTMGNTSYDDAGDRTFMWWMKVTTFPPDLSNYGGIFGKWSGTGGNEGYICRYRNNNDFWWFVWDSGGANHAIQKDISSYIASGEWHHFTVLHEAGVSQSLYIDGNLIDGVAFPAGESVNVNTAMFQIGNDDGSEQGMNGNLDDFAVFNTALSASVITQYSESGVPTDALDLVALYKFEEGTGATASNSADSPEGTGTILNNVTFSADTPYSSSGGGGITYATESIFVYKTAGDDIPDSTVLLTFSASFGINDGEIKYQLSNDGSIWRTWNTGSDTWTSASNNERTTEENANTYMSEFPIGIGDNIYVKSFLESNGDQQVELDSLTISYVTASCDGGVAEIDWYIRNLTLTHLNGSPTVLKQ